jgi:uncharacterized phage protein (TIGR01671 family)
MSQENRLIKFRAWEPQYKLMSEVTFIMFDTKELDCRHNPGEPKPFDCFELMQFTGLHDKNGVEIYEGDILAFEQEKNFKKIFIHQFEMKWDNDRAAWIQFSPREIVVVIGNIYQNPELITSNE